MVLFSMSTNTVEIPIGTIRFKGVWGVVGIVGICLAGLLYVNHRRSSLEEAASEQLREHLALELPSRLLREGSTHMANSEIFRKLQDFEITEIAVPWFPGDRARVRVEVSSSLGEETLHYWFRRSLGTWSLQHEARPGLLGR